MTATKKPMTVLILDQFLGPSPYQLQQQPMRFDELLAAVRGNPKTYTMGGHAPKIIQVENEASFRQDFATTAFIAGPDGMVTVWRARWDSSG